MTRNITIATILAAALALGGCIHSFDLPAGFARVPTKLDNDIYHTRGVSADGVVIALRAAKKPENSDLDFCAKATVNRLTSAGQYRLVENEEITTEAGLDGRLMTFSTERHGVEFTYVAAVFVTDGELLIAEAGGKTALVKRDWDKIIRAIKTVR